MTADEEDQICLNVLCSFGPGAWTAGSDIAAKLRALGWSRREGVGTIARLRRKCLIEARPRPEPFAAFREYRLVRLPHTLHALCAARSYLLAMDQIYDRLDPYLCRGEFAYVDVILHELDPAVLGAEVTVAVLIATLAAHTKLRQREDFIHRAEPILAQQPEGAEVILHGLRGHREDVQSEAVSAR